MPSNSIMTAFASNCKIIPGDPRGLDPPLAAVNKGITHTTPDLWPLNSATRPKRRHPNPRPGRTGDR